MQNETPESIQDGIETEAVDRHDFTTNVRNHFEAALAAQYVDGTELVVLGIRHGTDHVAIMEAISGYAYASRHTMPTEALHKAYAATRDAVYREDHARRETARVAKQDETPRNPTNTDPDASRKATARVGFGCTEIIGSDARPYEVVAVTRCSATVRRLKETMVEGDKPEMNAGGFCGHTTNTDAIRYHLDRDEDAPLIRVFYSKKGWQRKGTPFIMGNAFFRYDYNF